jgi:hypothetical protein
LVWRWISLEFPRQLSKGLRPLAAVPCCRVAGCKANIGAELARGKVTLRLARHLHDIRDDTAVSPRCEQRPSTGGEPVGLQNGA